MTPSIKLIHGFLLLAALSLTSLVYAAPPAASKPTIVLVHGAFADSSGWNDVVSKLQARGYVVTAVANPLRSVKSDAEYLQSALKAIPEPVVLVGHSYGGLVISNAVNGNKNVKALVYVAAYAPEPGESASALSTRFPGRTSGALAPVELPGGGKDLYVQRDKFRALFAADVPELTTRQMASTQRPVTEAALNEPSAASAWKTTPSYFIYGSDDRTIPAAAHAFMAERAQPKETVAVKGASHVVMISNPDAVANIIERAASSQ
jgi:pimeloyl-ACP methyl ester carboxylesterase